MSDKEFSLYEEEEKIILNATNFFSDNDKNSLVLYKKEFLLLLENYKKLFKQSKRLIRMSDKMEAELAITKAELEKYSDKLKIQATTDALTGLPNRRKIMMLLEDALNNSISNHESNFNIMMLDIDFFKKVNDSYGHPMGDLVIKEVSNHMQKKFGKNGVVGRFGGEEFLSIFYNQNKTKAKELADQIRIEIENKNFSLNNVDVSVTVSMGIASSLESNNLKKILDIADQRLYKAKESGRNQVVIN